MNLVGCDSPICEKTVSQPLMHEAGFLTVAWKADILNFCSWDCVIRYGLTTPVEPPYGTVGVTKGETS